MARPKRNPATVSEIIASFSDMPTTDQEGLLSTLSEICRILKRERSRTQPIPIDGGISAAQAFGPTPTVPTEWLTAPDLALQQRIAGDTTPEEHEN